MPVSLQPSAIENARRIVECFVTHYYTVRLHSVIGYVRPTTHCHHIQEISYIQLTRQIAMLTKPRN